MKSLEEVFAAVIPETAGLPLSDDFGPGRVSWWDSMANLAVVSALEEHYGIKLTFKEVIELNSIGDIRKLLADKGVSL